MAPNQIKRPARIALAIASPIATLSAVESAMKTGPVPTPNPAGPVEATGAATAIGVDLAQSIEPSARSAMRAVPKTTTTDPSPLATVDFTCVVKPVTVVVGVTHRAA